MWDARTGKPAGLTDNGRRKSGLQYFTVELSGSRWAPVDAFSWSSGTKLRRLDDDWLWIKR
jgi:hypothetical protein